MSSYNIIDGEIIKSSNVMTVVAIVNDLRNMRDENLMFDLKYRKLQSENDNLKKQIALQTMAMKGAENWGAVEATKRCVLIQVDGSHCSSMLSSTETLNAIETCYKELNERGCFLPDSHFD